MDDNITIHDLKTHLDILEKRLINTCVGFIDSLIYEGDEGYCTCGCMNLPAANILFRVQKSNIIRVYGLTIYPTSKCQNVIIDCDNRGKVIKMEIYETVKSWLSEIPREQERHAKRVERIKRELLERTDTGIPEEQNLNFII